MSIVDITLNEFLIFALVLLRMGGIVVFAPYFGGEDIPRMARIGLVVFLSFVTFGNAAATLGGMSLPVSLIELGGLAIREIMVGAVVGYGASLVFSGAQLAGQMIGQQVGFAMANVMDPMLEQEVGLISFLNFTLAIGVFLAFNLHLMLLKVLAMSYTYIGLGQAILRLEFLNHLIEMLGRIWDAGVQLGGPVLMLMILVSVIVGFVSRTMPQLNIIVIGLPTRTIIGMISLMLLVRPFVETMHMLLERMLWDVNLLLQYLAPEQVAA